MSFSAWMAVCKWDTHYPPAPHWTPKDMPDLTGKCAIVTGTTIGGMGYEIAKELVRHNAKVYLGARSKETVEKTMEKLIEETGKSTAVWLPLDLGDLKSIRKAGSEFLGKEPKLDILINNASVYLPPPDWLTKDGYDLVFGTVAIGGCYFTKLLIPALLAAPKPRVVFVTSDMHRLVPESGIDYQVARPGPGRDAIGSNTRYTMAKYALHLYCQELLRRYSGQGLTVLTLHPGTIRSNCLQHQPQWMVKMLHPLLYEPDMGAITSLWAATSPEIDEKNLNGKYLTAWARVGEAAPHSKDETQARAFWDYVEAETRS